MLRIKDLALIERREGGVHYLTAKIAGREHKLAHTHMYSVHIYMYVYKMIFSEIKSLCFFGRRILGVHSVKRLECNLFLFLIRNNPIKNPVQ